MKKTLVFTFVAAALMLLFTSCNKTETLPNRFDSFVDNVEKDCANYTEEDWDKANTQFEKMVDEFQQNQANYTEEEQKQVRNDISKYLALVTKSGFNSAIDAVNDFIKQVPDFFEEMGTFFKVLFTSPENVGETEE